MTSLLKVVTMVLVLVVGPAVTFAEVPQHTVRLYHDEQFLEEQEKFFPSDKIFVLIDFPSLPVQEYHLSVEWIRPDGVLSRNDTFTLRQEEDGSSRQVYFWLQLHEKGPVSQMLSGAEYSDHVFGAWKVRLYCNGELMSTAAFTVTDVLP